MAKGAEVGEAAEGEGDHGDGLVRELLDPGAEVGEGHELVDDQLLAQERAGRDRLRPGDADDEGDRAKA
jgi:hypothetical protein